MSRQKLIILDGSAATGKTTWLRAEKARLGGVVVTTLQNAAISLANGEARVYLDPDGLIPFEVEVKHFARREVHEVNGEEFSA